jgi:hypothetical protein
MKTQNTQTNQTQSIIPPQVAKPNKKQAVHVTKELLSKSAEGYPLLGNCLYWSISNIQLSHGDFVKHLQEVGIDVSYAGRVRAKSALLRALQRETAERKNCFHRCIVDKDSTHAIYVIVNQQVNQATSEVNFATDTRVIFDKKSGTIKVEGFNADGLIAKYVAEQGVYNTDNFRKVVLDYIYEDCKGISVRENGGIYFVPHNKGTEFEMLKNLFGRFPGCSLDVLPIIDTAEAKRSMWKSLVGEVEAELATQTKELKEIEDNGTRQTDGGIQNRLQRFTDLKGKVEMYETLLNGTAVGLKQQLEQVSALLKKQLV